MLHELLVALLGVPGDVVEARGDGFFVRPGLKFLSSPQRAQLDRVLVLGFAYAQLRGFVSTASARPSLFVRALAQGLERELDAYSAVVVRLEAKVLSTAVVLPLTAVQVELADFADVLPELARFVGMLEAAARASSAIPATAGNVSILHAGGGGAVLLGELYKKSGSGFPRIRASYQRLLAACHCILYKQMVAWMLYGELLDPYDEFFVKRASELPTARRATMTSTSVSSTPRQSASSQETLLWLQQFAMDLNAVATLYFPPTVAENVFFIGKAVHILARTADFSPVDAQKIVVAMTAIAKREIFDATALEVSIEQIRLDVASKLHSLVVVRSEFARFLEVLKGFFLLARGEVFHAFVERSFPLMLAKPNIKSEDDINFNIWQPTLREFQSRTDDVNPWLQAFNFQLPLQTFELRGFASTDSLAFAGLVRSPNGKSLSVSTAPSGGSNQRNPVAADISCGAAWWRHVQLDSNALSSELVIRLPALDQDSGKHHFALLFKNEDTVCRPSLIMGSFSLDQPPNGVNVCVELDIEVMAGYSELSDAPTSEKKTARVVCRIKSTRGSDKDVRESLPTDVLLTNELRCRVEYARQEMPMTGSTTHVMYKKVFAVSVEDTLVLQSQLDLQEVLHLNAANADYWVGVALSPRVQLSGWSLDKFAAKTSWRDGSRLSERNEPLTARELWSSLALHCDVPWPLQLLVSNDLLRSYSHLFQFCFRLKRVAHALERTWKSNVLRAHAIASALRGRMSFVVRNLELHLHVSVVESRYVKCVAQLAEATDFDRVKRVHEAFVAGVVKGCYVHTKTVAAAIDEVLSCCWRFAEYVLYQETQSAALSTDRVAVMADEFHRRFEFLHGVLQIAEARELLFLLEFNDFFTDERRRRKYQQQPSAASSTRDASRSVV